MGGGGKLMKSTKFKKKQEPIPAPNLTWCRYTYVQRHAKTSHHRESLTFMNTAAETLKLAHTNAHHITQFLSSHLIISLLLFAFFPLHLLLPSVSSSLHFFWSPSISSLISLTLSFPALPINSLFLDGHFSPWANSSNHFFSFWWAYPAVITSALFLLTSLQLFPHPLSLYLWLWVR